MVSDGFHELIIEIHSLSTRKTHIAFEKGILQPHHAKADGTMTHIRTLGGFRRVEIDVDNIVESTNGNMDRFAQHFMVERPVGFDVRVENDRPKVANRSLILTGIEGNLGAKVRRVDDSDVVLWTTKVAGVLECDPGMSCLEEHPEHLLPKIDGRHFLGSNFALASQILVVEIALLKLASVGIVQVGNFVAAEERPVLTGLHALHEEIGNPVGRVEIMRAAAVVASVAAELQEILHIIVPGLKVGTARATSLTTLIHCHKLVVVELEKGDNALTLAVCAFDVTASPPHRCPRAPETSSPLREVGIFSDAALHDRLDRVVYFVEVTTGKLAVERAGVKERRRARTKTAAFIKVVEAHNPVFALCRLFDEESHSDTHPEKLRRLKATRCFFRFINDEVAVVERLDSQKIEIHISGWVDGFRENIQIVSEQLWRKTLNTHSSAQITFKGLAMGITKHLDAVTLYFPIQNFLVNIRQHDASRKLGKIGIALDERPRIQNDRIFQDVFSHLGGEGSAQLALDLKGVEIEIETDGRKLNPFSQLGAIPENTLAITLGDHDEGFLDFAGLGFGLGFNSNFAVTGTLGTIENVALGDLVITLPHDFFLHEILHVFNMNKRRVAGAHAVAHPTSDGCGGFSIFLHGKEGAAASGLDLGFHPRNDRSIAANQANIQRLCLLRQRGCTSGADRAFKNEAFGDIVRIIFNEGFFNKEREIMLREAKRAALLRLLGQTQSHGVGDIRYEAAILLIEDVFLFA